MMQNDFIKLTMAGGGKRKIIIRKIDIDFIESSDDEISTSVVYFVKKEGMELKIPIGVEDKVDDIFMVLS